MPTLLLHELSHYGERHNTGRRQSDSKATAAAFRQYGCYSTHQNADEKREKETSHDYKPMLKENAKTPLFAELSKLALCNITVL